MPSVGKSRKRKYIKSWSMEPLSIAYLSAMTPKEYKKNFFDDRLEDIDYNYPTDLVAITVETYTAKRSYEIAKVYRDKNIKVVMGGFHPTLCPDEAMEYSDAIVVGECEELWENILNDFKNNSLRKIYKSEKRSDITNLMPDRSIYNDKKYLGVALVETGRGCPYYCDFCAIASFYKKSYAYRSIDSVVSEIKSLKSKTIFFVDDNFASNIKRAKELLKALISLKIKWSGQISINAANDDELLNLLQKSGCQMLLIGFESLNESNLKNMNKNVNISNIDYPYLISKFHNRGISIYATFAFGYDGDTKETIRDTMNFAIKNKFFLCAINHVVPFPGTDLYNRLKSENKLIYEKWWLTPNYSFGDVAFQPKNMTADELKEICFKYRYGFYSFSSIIKRVDFKANLRGLYKAILYFFVNIFNGAQIKKRQGLRLGEKR